MKGYGVTVEDVINQAQEEAIESAQRFEYLKNFKIASGFELEVETEERPANMPYRSFVPVLGNFGKHILRIESIASFRSAASIKKFMDFKSFKGLRKIEKIQDFYIKKEKLGFGSFGEVYKAENVKASQI